MPWIVANMKWIMDSLMVILFVWYLLASRSLALKKSAK